MSFDEERDRPDCKIPPGGELTRDRCDRLYQIHGGHSDRCVPLAMVRAQLGYLPIESRITNRRQWRQQSTGPEALPQRIVGRGLEVERPPIDDLRAVLAALRDLEDDDEQAIAVAIEDNPALPGPVSGRA